MSTIEITRVEDVREGDVVTLAFEGHEFTGKAWNDPYNEGLSVGGAAVRWYGIFPEHTFIRATREVDLPTEPGSVIVNATIRGTEGVTAILDSDGEWLATEIVGDCRWHRPEDITAWTPARIVAEGGVGVAR